MKLKDLPDEEKPRERILKYGVNNVSNEDLLSILIRTGNKEENVKVISSKHPSTTNISPFFSFILTSFLF